LGFISEKVSEPAMYPFPTGEFDNVMDVALDIAMDYSTAPGRQSRFRKSSQRRRW